MNAPPPLRLATVEDDPRFRNGLGRLLRSLSGFSLVATYASAGPALDDARKARSLGMEMPWDVLLTDIGLPGIDGVVLTRELKALFPSLCVVVLSVFEDPANVLSAICAGADGYLVKGASGDEMIAALDRLRSGQAPISVAPRTIIARIACAASVLVVRRQVSKANGSFVWSMMRTALPSSSGQIVR